MHANNCLLLSNCSDINARIPAGFGCWVSRATIFYSSPLAYILAHYDQLAEEILFQTDDRIDAVIVGVGTGGTIAGIARKIKERSPSTFVVGADPIGSILAIPGELNVAGGAYKVEGIGYDFVPRTCAR